MRQLILCAVRTTAEGAEEVLASACRLATHKQIAGIVRTCASQLREPLPPRALVMLAIHLRDAPHQWARPIAESLRDCTLRALMRMSPTEGEPVSVQGEDSSVKIEWDDFDLSGVWKGYYVQKDKRYPMDISLTFRDGRIYGGGIDPLDEYTIEGSYDLDSGEFSWIKQYIGQKHSHSVSYVGRWAGDRIVGNWKIRRLSDRFSLHPADRPEPGSVDQVSWAVDTARVLQTFLDQHQDVLIPEGYAVDAICYDELITELSRGPLDEIRRLVFGSLSATFTAHPEKEWRKAFLLKLIRLALTRRDRRLRNDLLSGIIMGITHDPNPGESMLMLDALLEQAAKIDPDTSELHVSVSRSLAHRQEWYEALEVAYRVVSSGLRDNLLSDFCTQLVNSDFPGAQRLSIEVATKIDQHHLRLTVLEELGHHQAILQDPVAYGLLVTMLAEAPELLQRLVQHACESNPRLAAKYNPACNHGGEDAALRVVREHERQKILTILEKISPDVAEKLHTILEKS